ncbi:MAG TPA: FG-GAP-like repeat-containing protein [Terriglobia bacterium]|nr:FG-GAP-like repeat-containing protein [Terriglobia bacterium]
MSHGLLIFLALILAVAAPNTARAQNFAFGAATLTTGATPVAVAEGDFNGDGVLDFAVSNSGSNTVSVFLSKPGGTYSTKTDYAVTTPGQIVVGDFNLDGKLDLVVATGINLDVLLGNGDGTFQNPAPQGVAATALVAGDFNKDGKLDLFVASSASGLYLGNGNGTFTLTGTTLGSYSYVNAADFNGDGKLDVLLSNVSRGQAYLGDGVGGFTAAGTTSGPGQMPVVADFNGDGKPDVDFEVTSCGRSGCHYNLYVYLGVGDGTFTLFTTLAVSATETQLIAADFNQDGKQDLLAVPSGVMLGNGDGTFQPAVAAPLGITPAGAVVGDFNNDGQLDIGAVDKNGFLDLSVGNHGSFAATGTGSTVSEVLGPSTVFADLNGDGKLDEISYGSYPTDGLIVQLGNGDGTFQAPQILPGGPMGSSIVVGDFNNDGKLDLAINGPGSTTLTFAIYLGNGDGTFQSPLVTSSNVYALDMAAADVNGDGKLDVIFVAENGASLAVYLGNGDGTFGPPTYYNYTGFAVGLVVADFNQDGKPDIAVPCPPSLCVLIGNGDGTFQPPKSYGTASAGTPLVQGDFNGDGKIDLAAGAFVYLGNGDGTFQAPTAAITNADILAMTAGDFNHDGRTDLAMLVYPYTNGLIRLFYSNGDGTFASSSLLGSPSGGIAAGDLNGDGAPDLFASTPGSSTSTTYTSLNVPVVSLAPGQLNFPNQAVGSTGSPLTLTVSNSGIASLTLGTTTVTGDFAVSLNTCSSTLASGASCTLQVTFTPTVLGPRTGLLTLASNSFGGAANLLLAGNGAVSGAQVQLSASSLTFGNQAVGTTSPSQIVTVTSSGGGPVTFSSFATTGDFTQTNNCPTVLNPSATCTVSVTFVPTAAGTRTGSLVISDNAPGGSQSVSLTGTGTAPSVTLKPTSLTFATQVLNTSSVAKSVTLTNTGTVALTITSLTFSGANPTSFTETNTCGTSVAAGASCSISVKFRPTAINTLTATLNVNDNAAGSPQTVSLTGTGTQVQLLPKSLNFGSVTVGTKSGVKKVTLTNVAQTTVSITSISIGGTNATDFAETTTCGSKVQAEASCTFSITFTPSAKGSRTATLSIADNGGGSPQTVSLSGTGK